MLKFVTVGAVLSAIISTSIAGILPLPEKNTEQKSQNTTSNLVVTDGINDTHTGFTNAKTSIVLASGSDSEVPEVDSTGVMLGLAAVGGVAIGVALSRKNGNNTFWTSPTLSHSVSQEDGIHIDRASRNLQKKLMILLHDDKATANRLLSQVKRNNPNKSINWYVEKVIYDLERDRGGY